MDKVLIEESNVELLELFDQVSNEAKIEKNASPAINKMSYWWTRKPLVVGRATILTSTLNDIQAVKDLMGLNREKRAYTYIPDAGVYKKKLGKDPSKIKVLDPFGGAGNLIFEAKRLGLDCTVSDYNPVAYLIEKAILEYPPKYGAKLAEDFEKYAKLVIKQTEEEIGKFYDKNDLVYLWVWCIKCPHCRQRVPLTNHMWIVNSEAKKIGVRFHKTKDGDFTTELIRNMKPEEGKKFTQKGGAAICISCTNAINYDDMTNDIAKRRDREMIAKQIQGQKKHDYVESTEEDKKLFKKASEYMKSKFDEYEKEDLIPDEDILPSHRREHTLWHYGIRYWRDFFSDRQLLVMTTLLKNIKIICDEIDDEEYRKVIALYAGFLLCNHLSYNSLGIGWNKGYEKIQHVMFARQPRIMYNHAETNPFEETGGSLSNSLKNILGAIRFSMNDKNLMKVSLESVLRQPSKHEKYDLIITDPPYLDDVQYGELSEFYYIWLSRVLQESHSELPSRVNLDEDICESWGRFGDKTLAHDFFEKGFKRSFGSLNEILKDDGLLVVFFAHSNIGAWNLLLDCIRESNFRVVSSYAMHTENPNNIIAKGKTSFLSSIIVACRKISRESTAYFEDTIPEVEDKIKEMLKNIPVERLLVLPITDLLIMVYGKVLEATTLHTTLKSYRKDLKPDFKLLIEHAREFIMKEIVSKLTGRSLNLIGSQMSFYLLTKIFYRGILAGDDAIKAARTYGLDMSKIEENNLGTKEKGIIRLFYLHEKEIDKKPEEIDSKNIHEQLCYLAHIVDKQGASKMSSILTQAGRNFKIDELKQMISILLKSFRLRMNKGEQLIPQEQKELKILETISDVMGIKSEGSLDSFVK